MGNMSVSEIITSSSQSLEQANILKEAVHREIEAQKIAMGYTDDTKNNAVEESVQIVDDVKNTEEEIVTDNVEHNNDQNINKTKKVTIDDEDTGFEPITETFDEYLERHINDESLAELPINEKTAAEVIKTQYNDISITDASKLANIIKRWKDNEIPAGQAYNEFPSFITSNFNSQLFKSGASFKMQATYKKEFAKSVLNDLMLSVQLQQATDDVNVQIDNVYKEYGDDITTLYQASIFEKIDAMKKAVAGMKNKHYDENNEKAKELGKEEWELRKSKKIELVESMIEALYESFKFEKFAKKIGHIKVKKIDLTDTKRCFSHFNSKYANSNFSRADVSSIIPIIEKHCGFSHDEAVEFAVIFCIYCRNMRPSNINEHIFMYYSISNINSLIVMHDSNIAKFSNGLIGNIKALMNIYKAKSNGDDYVSFELTDEEIDEIIKKSSNLIQEKESTDSENSNDIVEETINN